MRILLTGASGFLGKNLLTKLLSQGFDIILLSRNIADFHYLSKYKIKHLLYSDENGFKSEEIKKPDVIIHLATYFISEHKSSDIKKLVDANILLGLRLLEYSKQEKIDIIYTSSFAQSSSESLFTSQNLYVATKKVFEDLLLFYSNTYQLRVINLELFDTYGPEDSRNKIVNSAIKSFVNNIDFKMSNGNQEICLLHINDVVNAINHSISLLSKTEGYKKYTLLNDSSIYKLKDLILQIKNILESKSKIELGFYQYRKNEIFRITSKQSKLLGWSPSINLIKGILQTAKK